MSHEFTPLFSSQISLTKMGLIQLAKKDFDTAIMIFSQVLRARRKNLGYHHPEVAKTLSNIACVHFECGGLLPASKALEESIEILRNATDGGSLEPALATVLSNFGFVLAKRRMFNDATRVYEEALGLRVQHCVFASIAETRENLAYARASSSISTSKPRGDGTCVDISKMMEPLLDNLQCS
jgi:tetratricopeptide (TPR) repeat protein